MSICLPACMCATCELGALGSGKRRVEAIWIGVMVVSHYVVNQIQVCWENSQTLLPSETPLQPLLFCPSGFPEVC